MKKVSNFQIIVIALVVLFTICALVIPSVYVEGQNAIVMGYTTTFGGSIKISGSSWKVGFCWQLLVAWILPIVAGLLVALFGKNQKSTYFFAIILFVASGIIYGFTKKYFLNVNVAGSIIGIQSALISAQPYVCISLLSLAVIVSLVAIFYRPNKRYSRY